jgi:nitrogen PTS system EIIA component
MEIRRLLTPDRTLCGIDADNRRHALEILAKTIAQDIPELDADGLLKRFLARERLGSTGIGSGIAIPHCIIDRSCNTKQAIGALITLARPVNYDAIDGQAVDILFAMLVPEDAHDEHLQNLAALASALINDQFRQRLRAAEDGNSLYEAAIS